MFGERYATIVDKDVRIYTVEERRGKMSAVSVRLCTPMFGSTNVLCSGKEPDSRLVALPMCVFPDRTQMVCYYDSGDNMEKETNTLNKEPSILKAWEELQWVANGKTLTTANDFVMPGE